jgi:hypothetical protein
VIRLRRFGFSRFWFATLLTLATFTAATVPVLSAIILAAAIGLFRVTWRVPLSLAVAMLAFVPFVGVTPYHGVANLIAFFVIELMGLAIAMAIVETRRSEPW